MKKVNQIVKVQIELPVGTLRRCQKLADAAGRSRKNYIEHLVNTTVNNAPKNEKVTAEN